MFHQWVTEDPSLFKNRLHSRRCLPPPFSPDENPDFHPRCSSDPDWKTGSDRPAAPERYIPGEEEEGCCSTHPFSRIRRMRRVGRTDCPALWWEGSPSRYFRFTTLFLLLFCSFFFLLEDWGGGRVVFLFLRYFRVKRSL